MLLCCYCLGGSCYYLILSWNGPSVRFTIRHSLPKGCWIGIFWYISQNWQPSEHFTKAPRRKELGSFSSFLFSWLVLLKVQYYWKKKIKNKKYRLHSNCVAGSSLRAFDRSLVITTVLLCKEADTWIISYSFVSSGQLAREHDCNWSQAESIQPLTANSLVSGKLWSIEHDRFFRKRAVISDLRPKGSIARLRYNPATEVIQWQMRLANCYDYLHVEDWTIRLALKS